MDQYQKESLFMRAQIKRIEEDKYFAGCERQRDPGSAYVMEWIERQAIQFRHAWDISRCCHCILSDQCGHHVKLECNTYQQRPEA